ncbi:tRNA nucleotidyltransferase (CCA-adding enzyme) [Bacillus ectoiniformans]|uniref:CCA tRNA nucleotidyltransferase n=1 Tax=Bacillus ectoiniformans TaxID=1494429 RepID=UPI00195CF044|nr:CCA tRNA nucleotidyltransferase [Bacillus ectoiniformans]MBM7647970.1 tRNA nucleotidyltransferase (CCA-adding enzyme) [Bacillus ectoiniformans]
MKNEELFIQAAPILKELEEAGYDAYYVGGAVRDYLLGRPIGDVDIATSALPEEVKALFPKTVDVGIEHGTVLIIYRGEGYEVTTFRTESDYKDFRRPETVAFVRSLQEDLKRRDFTINAMAMDRSLSLVDPFQGQKDLRDKRIQTVGSAWERFTEDALRMMRAARFVSQLNFELDEATADALIQQSHLLKHIAVERKLNEMEKLLGGPGKKKGLRTLLQGGLYPFLPGIGEEKQILERILDLPIDSLTADQMWLLLTWIASPERPDLFLKEWRMPAKKVKSLSRAVQLLRERQSESWTRYKLYQAGLATAVDVEEVHAALHENPRLSEKAWLEEEYHKLPIYDRQALAVSGEDLKAWKDTPGGPWIKGYLEKIEQAVINGESDNDREKIKEWLKSCNLL